MVSMDFNDAAFLLFAEMIPHLDNATRFDIVDLFNQSEVDLALHTLLLLMEKFDVSPRGEVLAAARRYHAETVYAD